MGWTREMLVASRNERCLREWGCSWDRYAELLDLKDPISKFKQQRASAGKRGIGWELSLWQWWSIWQESGKWAQRGCGQGYVMCRNGDVGPYSVGNVFIATCRENSSNQPQKKSEFPMGVRKLGDNSFEARRKLNGKTTYLGCHRTPELAHAAYLAADGAPR